MTKGTLRIGAIDDRNEERKRRRVLKNVVGLRLPGFVVLRSFGQEVRLRDRLSVLIAFENGIALRRGAGVS